MMGYKLSKKMMGYNTRRLFLDLIGMIFYNKKVKCLKIYQEATIVLTIIVIGSTLLLPLSKFPTFLSFSFPYPRPPPSWHPFPLSPLYVSQNLSQTIPFHSFLNPLSNLYFSFPSQTLCALLTKEKDLRHKELRGKKRR